MTARRIPPADLAWTVLLTFVVLGPLLVGRGFWLFGDMVFVPEQPWKDTWLGLDGTLPRAVPMDAVVSVLTQVLPGEVVQRLLLVAAFVAGGLGAGRLVADHRVPARLAAISLMLWNPWVHERLLMGQWAILAGYLLLPWVAVAATRLRDDVRCGAPAAAVALVLSAVCSPSSGVMAAFVAVVLAARREVRQLAVLAGLVVAANLCWLVPSLLADARTDASREVFEAFAARGESGLGALPSLLSLGGTWKTSIVADERTYVVVVLLSCALTAVALLGLRGRADPRLAAVAAVSLLLAALPTLPGGVRLLAALGDAAPALAFLRDSHRFLAPAVLLLLPGIAGAVTGALDRVRPGREAMAAVAGLLVVAPVLLLPSLAWGELGGLEPASYPGDWRDVADRIRGEDPARTVVLPWAGSYRGFDWNDDRAVLDPAPRFLPGEVLVDDRVVVAGTTIRAEDPVAEEVTGALTADDPAAALRGRGVRWVLVEKGMPSGPVPQGEVAVDGDELTLVDLGAPDEPARRTAGDIRPLLVGIGHVVSAATLLAGLVLLRCPHRRGSVG